MTLVLLAGLSAGVLQDAHGNVLPNRQVNVYARGTTTPVQVYSDAAGASPATQPVTTDSSGLVPGYVTGGVSVDIVDALTGLRAQGEPVSAANVANVFSFNAKGDGTTDDTAAVLAAITAGNARYVATGGITDVVLPSGYEFLIGQMHILSGVRIRAEGAAILPNLNNWPQLTAGLLFWFGTGILTDFSIHGGTWLGTGSETNTQTLFYTGSNRGVQDVTLRDMKITNWGISPLYLRNPTRARVNFNTLINPGVGAASGLNAINFVFDGGAAAGGKIMAIGNIIESSWAAAIAAVVTDVAAGSVPMNIIFADNITTGASGAARPNSGAIVFEIDVALNDSSCIIHDNQISSTSTNQSYAILIGSTLGALAGQRVLVHHNDITVTNAGATGIWSATSGGSPDVAATDNRITAPIPFQGTFNQRSGNRLSGGASQGRATLVGGTVTVSTAEIQTGDNVLLTVVSAAGTRGEIQLGTIVNATSFVINSIQPGTASTLQSSDTSTVFWQIVH